MEPKRLRPAAIGALVLAGGLLLPLVLLGTAMLAADLVSGWLVLAGPVLVLVAGVVLCGIVIRRVRRRDDLSAQQKAVLTGLMIGAAVGFPMSTVFWLAPTPALVLGLPTTMLGSLLEMALGTPRDDGSAVSALARFPLVGPASLLAVNCCLVGSLAGWIASARREGERAVLKRLGLALGWVLGPALAFLVGIGLMAGHGNFAAWEQNWRVMSTRQRGNELMAAIHLRAIASAQSMYVRYDGHYARPFNRLREDKGKRLNLIDNNLAKSPRRSAAGYLFFDVPFDAEGRPVDPGTDFAVCAYPSRYGKSGFKTFYLTTDGTVRRKDTHGYPIVVLPADPEAEGWVVTGRL